VANQGPIARPTDSGAIAALVVGLIAPIGAMVTGVPGLVMGTVAVFLGLRAQARIKGSGGTVGGAGMARAGWIIGLIAIVLGAVFLVLTIGPFFFKVTNGAKGGP
jgi:hypothetical protein